MDDEEFKMISESGAFCSYIAISQVNGDPEKKANWYDCCLRESTYGEKIHDAKTLFLKLKKANASLLDLSKDEAVEMRRQIWTTNSNLNGWFDAWEKFLIIHGFASETVKDNGEKEIIFSEEPTRKSSK